LDSTGSGKSTVVDLKLSVFNLYTRFWWGSLRARGNLQGETVKGRIILKWILKKYNRAWAGFYWLRKEYSCRFEAIIVQPLYKVLVGKPEGKRQLARSNRKGEDNIQMDPQEELL
jgi:hypothetical protein